MPSLVGSEMCIRDRGICYALEWPGGCRLQRGTASRHSYSKRIAALNDATTNLHFLANRWAFPVVDRAEYMETGPNTWGNNLSAPLALKTWDKCQKNGENNLKPPTPRSSFQWCFGGQDIDIDAEDEDLPPGWVKKQRKNGSVYYFHTMTAATTSSPPRERGESSPRTAATVAPPRPNGIRSLFRVRE